MKYQRKKYLLLFVTKLIEKTADASNAKEYYKSYLKRKKIKLVKRSKIISQQWKTIENPNNVDIRSVIREHPQTSHNLSKAIKQAAKVSQISVSGKKIYSAYSLLYSETKIVKIFCMKKIQK